MAPKKKKTSPGSPRPATPKPDWPAFSPLIPPSDLALEQVLPEHIITIPNLWTSTLCKNYVAFLSSLPLTTTPGKPNKGEAVRVNDRYQIDDPAFAQRLWSQTALQSLVEAQDDRLWGGKVVGLNPNIRIYRYSKGQFFDQHYDDSNNLSLPGTPPAQARTTWTLLLYLTSPATGCTGGETVFYPDPPKKKNRDPSPKPLVVSLDVGLALLHRHGADCILHEGRQVLEGEKWVIRSDLCVAR
ncbi:hypothetical protein BDU57DRAFT_513886 [Ampelomyces quisqualis]|uniref:Fe2OG dioxygenase domain-containing protein n=1 Tax=Ampelomyces quisqualis TaxID=50730 RepID=A0A6A5QPF4_AMPQU|nr:hypothetical protein BDU57DRAFT_513886 [Ampelomyces quisqualis]